MKKIAKYCISIIGMLLLIILLLGYSNLGNLSVNENKENHFLKIGKEKIRFSQKGNGKDILLIHGTPGSIEDWTEIMEPLSENFRVTAFDRLGHGFSTSNQYSYHLKDNAILVENIIKKLKLKSPLIVGHSYGGSIAAYMAVNSKLKEIDYIIMDSPLYTYQPTNIYKIIATPVIGKGIAFLSSFTIAEDRIKEGVLAQFEATKKNAIDKVIKERQRIWSQPKVIFSKSKESVNYQDDLNSISNKYKNINTKVTIITSTFLNDCERIHKEVANSELIFMKKTGHYIQLEHPLKMIEIISKRRK
jgi:pimeloyl-ACP methyl ester carboxylesterase